MTRGPAGNLGALPEASYSGVVGDPQPGRAGASSEPESSQPAAGAEPAELQPAGIASGTDVPAKPDSSSRARPPAESAPGRREPGTPRTVTVRLPRLRVPKVTLPFTLVQAEPDPVAERAGRDRRSARFAAGAGRGFARVTV